MKTIFLFLVTFIIPAFVLGQYNNEQEKYPNVMNYKVVTEQEPFFPAGEDVFFNYFLDNIIYSEEAKEKNISGNVMVSFDVMPDSTITGISVLRGVGYGVDDQVKKLLSQLKYAPGIENGDRVKMNVILNIFVVSH